MTIFYAAIRQVEPSSPPAVGVDLSDLATKLTAVRSRIAALGSLSTATALTAAPLKTALSDALDAALAVQAQLEAALGATTNSVANVVAGTDGAVDAAAFLDYAATAEQAPEVNDIIDFLTRMIANMDAAGM